MSFQHAATTFPGNFSFHQMNWDLIHPNLPKAKDETCKIKKKCFSSQIRIIAPTQNLRGLISLAKSYLFQQAKLPSPVPRRHFRYSGVRFRPPSLTQIPSRETNISHRMAKGKSSSKYAFLWGDMWVPWRVCNYVKKKIYIYNIQKKQ